MTTTIDLFCNADEYLMSKPCRAVFEEGQPGDVMDAIIDGEVQIALKGRRVDSIGPGGIIGEMARIDNGPHSGTARARILSKLVPTSQKRFTFLVQQTPYFSIQVMRIMAERLRRLMTPTLPIDDDVTNRFG